MNRYLEKVAESLAASRKEDAINTGITGLAGGVTGLVSHKILSTPRFKGLGDVGKFGISTGVGLVGDYAAVRAMHHTKDLVNKERS